jgi:hypothetical protein
VLSERQPPQRGHPTCLQQICIPDIPFPNIYNTFTTSIDTITMTDTHSLLSVSVSVDELTKKLNGEAQRQESATPDREFEFQHQQQSFDWICETERSKYIPSEVESIREGIQNPSYWEREAQQYLKFLNDLILTNICSKFLKNGKLPPECWKDVAIALKPRLRRQGATSQQINERRLSILDQDYWEPEAVALQKKSASRQHEMLEDHWKKKEQNQENQENQESQKSNNERKRREADRSSIRVPAKNQVNHRISKRRSRR